MRMDVHVNAYMYIYADACIFAEHRLIDNINFNTTRLVNSYALFSYQRPNIIYVVCFHCDL